MTRSRSRPSRSLLRGVAGLLCSLAVASRGMAMDVGDLRCEDRAVAVGVDVPRPRLSWTLASDARDQRQKAYQIRVATTAAALAGGGDLWDSGPVRSDRTLGIEYAGRPLATGQAAYWSVRAWDGDGRPSAWSAPATWTMGIVDPHDWAGAHWISAAVAAPSLLLRRDFDVRPGLARAVVMVSGLGYYDLTFNGTPATPDRLTPGWTKYDKTVLYDTYDVTAALHAGRNAAGLCLGGGMYDVPRAAGRYTKFDRHGGPLQAIARLRLDYADGTHDLIVTDTRWRTSAGPITFGSVYGGEDCDARLAQDGWDRGGYDAAAWPAAVATDGPGGVLRGLSAAAPPVREIETHTPVAVRTVRPGVIVYDFGQNAAHVPRVTVHGPAGATVRLLPGELLHADGTVDQFSIGQPTFCVYTLAGGGAETWSPRFFYCGYRYLQVETHAPAAGGATPTVEAVRSAVVHTASPPAGTFACSNERFNRVYSLVRWAQRSNMVSVLTDCPHREKLGWLEQIHLNGPALRYNFDLSAFFAKTMNDMADSQLANGMVPTTAPEYPVFGGNFRDSPEWGSAFLLVAWQQYQFTGDPALLARYYEPMRRYVDYLGTRAKDHIVAYGLSDWYDIGPGAPGESKLTPKGVTATAFYYADTVILAKAAGLLDKADDAKRYTQAAADIRAAFNAHYFHADTGQYASGSQCADAMPLVLGLVEPAHADAVLAHLVEDVQRRGLTAGDIGYKFLLNALAAAGRSDVIAAMVDQDARPGYGMQLARGATSLTEAWDANPQSSQNHFMLGQINEWFFADLAGIQLDPAVPGFGHVIVRPACVGGVDFVRATYASVHGPIRSAWTRDGRHFTLEVTVPANSTATVYVPAADPAGVTESGRPAAGASGVSDAGALPGVAVFHIASGTYRFASTLPG